ncbi:MAG: MATE family efflux transporter [Proteobacteria bacterium]|nr:MATE family efflux transporter [Pseudomonadota bacterium]
MNAPVTPPAIEVSNRRMLVLAVPMMLSHITVPLLGLVDTVVIGQLGDAALLGGVALGAIVFDLLFWTFGSLRMTTIAMTAQATGAGDRSEGERVLARALMLAFLIGAVMMLIQVPVMVFARKFAGASPEVTAAMSSYFEVRIWSAPAALANYVLAGALLGRGRSGLALAHQAIINLTNAGLSVVLVMGMKLGVPGVALGTAISEYLGVALGVTLLLTLGVSFRPLLDRASYARKAVIAALASNRDAAIRNAGLLMVFLLFTRTGARNGDIALAANSVLQNLWLFGAYFLDGFATAAETLCGMAIGARARETFRQAVRLAIVWSLGTGIVIGAVTILFGNAFIDFATANPEVRQAARSFLPYAALMPVLGAMAFAYDGIFIGANWTNALRNQMMIACAGFLVALWLLSGMGNQGLWLAFLIFMVLRGTIQASMYPALAARAFPATPSR